jgi:aspartyl-tRNA(Asn)/glutamyl-tRNA(Gln) amidotransferase subunit C
MEAADFQSQKRPGCSRSPETHMEVDANLVRRIARLARIKVSDAEAQALQGELSGILDWVAQLDEVKTDGVEPMTRVIPMTLRQRTDEVTDGEIPDKVVANAPQREGQFYVVPKVVE